MRRRFARGEIDEAAYQRQRELILSDLSPAQRADLGTSTPQPVNLSPRPGTPRPLGPSGGMRSGVRTSIPSLADLDLKPGTVLLDQWRLEKELGRGGFGAVFAAEELHLHEKQAVKVLDPAMVAKEELLARFRREVSLMRKLVHQRIVRVYDYREDLQQLVALISMELVSGGSVKQLLAAARARELEVPLPLALEILRQTLEALAEGHEQGVIHRDVTPGNVLLAGGTPEQLLADPRRDPIVKLVDFGIAGLIERSERSQKGPVLGTAAYVAPEVLDPSVEVTPAADIYGAGAMGYELLTGKLPLGRFAEPSSLRRGLPAAVNTLVLSLLEAQPSERPSARAAMPSVGGLVGEARAASERRVLLAELEARLAAALGRGEESAVAALAGDLDGALAATGETSEVGARVQTWLAARERERRDAAAHREREAAEARRREQVARREAEERARQARQTAVAEAARAVRSEERPVATAPARAGAPSEKRRGVPGWVGLVAAVVVVVLGLFVYQQVEARREAERRQLAAQREQARQQAAAEERLRQQQAEAAQRLEQERQRVARDTTERLRREAEQRARQEEVAPATAIPPPTPTAAPETPRATVAATAPAPQPSRAGIRWVRIPSGSFTMGCTEGDRDCNGDEMPKHSVTISRSFELAATETTVGQYQACVAAGRCAEVGGIQGGIDHPVVKVSWTESKVFCEWAEGRLPSEAEWEYAARGGGIQGMKYPWGTAISHENANYGSDSCCSGLAQGRDRWEETSPVGSFAANGYGLFDLSGNVWEWVSDWKGSYSGSSETDPTGSASGTHRVLRGGSYFDAPWILRVSFRGRDAPDIRHVNYGFRCARTGNP